MELRRAANRHAATVSTTSNTSSTDTLGRSGSNESDGPSHTDGSHESSTSTSSATIGRKRVHTTDGPERAKRKRSARTSTSKRSSTKEKLHRVEAQLEHMHARLGLVPPDISGVESRLGDLNIQEDEAIAKAPRKVTEGLFRTACSTDVLFLMDATGSMSPYIRAAKEKVKTIIDDINSAFLHEAEVRIAIVAYRDHEASPNIEFLDFTTSVSDAHSFLQRLRLVSGDDWPEDVLGGIQQAVRASWKNENRCLIHIGDAPAHGRALHDFSDHVDRYLGRNLHDVTHTTLLKELIDLRINYAFLRIENFTDRMVFVFAQAYAEAAATCTLHPKNKYFSQLTSATTGPPTGELIFMETDLGTNYDALTSLVVNTVTSSASNTAERHTSETSSQSSSRYTSSSLESISEEDSEEQDTDADMKTVVPKSDPEQPDPLSEYGGWLVLEGYSPSIVYGPSTLNDMMADDNNITIDKVKLVVNKEKKPFEQGSQHMAFKAETMWSNTRYVVKTAKRNGKTIPYFVENMRIQALCKAFALEFNSILGPDHHTLDYVVTACLKGRSFHMSNDPIEFESCLSLERLLPGSYIKYNNNKNHVASRPDDPINDLAQAFSHFTYERSLGQFLVCDLQGVNGVLTDPVMHTADAQRFPLSQTNLGREGIKFFFSSHKCNGVCATLALKSNRRMFRSGEVRFRTSWPAVAGAVCCSNKFCGRVLALDEAAVSDSFPGFQWCDDCFPQLDGYKAYRKCFEEGCENRFEVSTFFHESQGGDGPLRCAVHQEE